MDVMLKLLLADWNFGLTDLCLFLISKMMKMKAEARLDLLRQVGVAVETWLKSAMNQVMEELENECWSSLSDPDVSLSVRATVMRPFQGLCAVCLLLTYGRC